MSHISYRIVSTADGWIIEHEGQSSRGYDLPEAAYETAVAAASLDLKERRDITISVEFPESPEDTEALGDEAEPAVQRAQFNDMAAKPA